MSLHAQTTRGCFLHGAVSGAVIWTVYALVECLFSSILPRVIQPGYDYTPLHPGFTALLFVLYPAAGFVLGGLAGFFFGCAKRRFPRCRESPPEVFLPLFSTFLLVMTYTSVCMLNKHSHYDSPGLSEVPLVMIALFLAFAVLLSITSATRFARLRFLTNPWTVSVVLIGPLWMLDELLFGFSRVWKAAAALGCPLVVFMISWFIQKPAQTSRLHYAATPVPPISIRPLLFVAAAAMLALGTSSAMKQEPLVVPPALRSPGVAAGSPNVLLIVMDTVRADHLSLYGYERDTTPNLRELSLQATLYAHAVSPSDITLAGHASLFTGLYPSQHGAHRSPASRALPPLDGTFDTLAEILSEHGMATLAVVANHTLLSHHFNTQQGFQYYDVRFPVPFLAPTKWFYIRQGVRDFLTLWAPRSSFDRQYRTAEDINREVFRLLNERVQGNTPFLLFINYMDAHEPYMPPAPFDSLYPGKMRGFIHSDYRKLADAVNHLVREETEKERSHLLSQYDGGIAYMDHHIGALMNRLRELDLYEDSLILVVSDHGEVFGRRSFMGHGVSVYQDQVGVPLLIKYPRLNKRSVVDSRVSLIDILPTILDVLEIPLEVDIPGRSLVDLPAVALESRILISESFSFISLAARHSRFDRVERAIFSGPYKFIGSTSGKRELYDPARDPKEENDLSSVAEETTGALESKLDRWIAEVGATHAKEEEPPRLNKEKLDRLRSLGYIH
jgi:arylsulfatase A-like enzyme